MVSRKQHAGLAGAETVDVCLADGKPVTRESEISLPPRKIEASQGDRIVVHESGDEPKALCEDKHRGSKH